MVESERTRPRVAAHRGASALRPENTMVAFDAALRAGADAIEFDVHQTVDGGLVVLHDYHLARTTDGEGLVHERTLDYVRSLDAGRWFAEEFAAERVPVAEEVLALPVSACEFEVKGLPSQALVAAVCRALEACGRADSIEVTGHHHQMVSEIKQRVAVVRTGFFSPRRQDWMPARLYHQLVEQSAIFGNFDVVHAGLADLRALDVERLHRQGLLVHAGDVNGAGEVSEAIDLGVDHLTTNDPAAALRLRTLDGNEALRVPGDPSRIGQSD